jgi:hypothetical protein
LERIGTAIGLDYFDVDCSLDRAGNVLVFEANATMLVHAAAGAFAYRQAHVSRIKEAFAGMLMKRARGGSDTE